MDYPKMHMYSQNYFNILSNDLGEIPKFSPSKLREESKEMKVGDIILEINNGRFLAAIYDVDIFIKHHPSKIRELQDGIQPLVDNAIENNLWDNYEGRWFIAEWDRLMKSNRKL